MLDLTQPMPASAKSATRAGLNQFAAAATSIARDARLVDAGVLVDVGATAATPGASLELTGRGERDVTARRVPVPQHDWPRRPEAASARRWP